MSETAKVPGGHIRPSLCCRHLKRSCGRADSSQSRCVTRAQSANVARRTRPVQPISHYDQ
jgi:hypothetical protein